MSRTAELLPEIGLGLLDPALRTLEVLRPENGRWSIVATHHDDAKVRAEPFDVFELDLAVLWADVAR